VTLSEVTRRRIAALLLVAGVVVAVLAIADLGPFEDPPTQEERVQTTVEDFFAAAADGDSRTFCRLLTEQARKTLRTNTARQIRAEEIPGCREILEALETVFAGSEITVRHVSVSGPQARVEGRYRAAEGGARPRTILLLEEKGEWRISDPG
jgi:ketosteroid isomerase-like protein